MSNLIPFGFADFVVLRFISLVGVESNQWSVGDNRHGQEAIKQIRIRQPVEQN